uniref:SFRICE_005653 n=1 Tax=Spodoptera frugiperda TaxID=7108 RepID=A0A2H1WAT1_SPOFR
MEFDKDSSWIKITSWIKIYYEWVLSQKGKRMIMVDGYTYSKKSQNGWVCSTRNAFCRARLRLNAEGLIIYIDDKHSHAPKNQFRIRSVHESVNMV